SIVREKSASSSASLGVGLTAGSAGSAGVTGSTDPAGAVGSVLAAGCGVVEDFLLHPPVSEGARRARPRDRTSGRAVRLMAHTIRLAVEQRPFDHARKRRLGARHIDAHGSVQSGDGARTLDG